MRSYHRFPFVLFSFLNSCLFASPLVGQSLIVEIHNLPKTGGRIQVLCDLEGKLIYQIQFDYTPGTTLVTKEIHLPLASGYRLRAAVTKGLGKLPLILATGKTDNVDVGPGSREATIALGAPRAELVQAADVQGERNVVFRYDDTAALLEVGDPVTLWCTKNDVKINAAGRNTVAPVKANSAGQLFASFAVPNSDGATYCQAGYYSTHFTMADQIPVFVYPDLTSGAKRLNVSNISAVDQESAAEESSTGSLSLTQPALVKRATITTIRTGKDGRLERVPVSSQK